MFGYTHEYTLDSGYALLSAMLHEHNFTTMDRNWQMKRQKEDEGEYVEHIDFNTGKTKRVKVCDDI